MKKFILFFFGTLLIAVLLFEGLFFGITAQKKDVFRSSYQSMIVDKYRRLQNIREPKIIMVAGSSSSFGLDQNMLEEATGYKVVNLGLHAGFGHLFNSEIARENIQPGDIVLLGYEYSWIDDFDAMDQGLIMSGIDHNTDLYQHIPAAHWKDYIGYLFQYAQKKNAFEDASGIYSRDAFDPETTQMNAIRDFVMSNYPGNESTYGRITLIDEEGKVSISERSVQYIRSFKKYIESRGASVYFVSSPIFYDSLDCETEDFLRLVELEEELIGIPYLSDPRLYMFPMDLIANSINHCNTDGEKIRTSILIDDLRRSGAIPDVARSDTLKDMSGEPLVLVDALPKRLFHRPVSVQRVYLTDKAGHTVLFEENIDYTVDYDFGTIARTAGSRIPNYSDHFVKYTKGRFIQYQEDGEINPESNLGYQIQVDYQYRISEEELQPLENRSGFLSDSLRQKLLQKEPVRITLIGDGVGLGLDTDEGHTFLNLLETALSSCYETEVRTTNLSRAGGTASLLSETVPAVLQDPPDLVMIELGLNDHCTSDYSSEESRETFRKNLENAVQLLQANGIDVILIGFFQQNMTWEPENVGYTSEYNAMISRIAGQNQLFFADIRALFNRVAGRKPLNRDIMADFIHHPNAWGHRLYFSSLLPLFNLDGAMKSADFPDYIFVGSSTY